MARYIDLEDFERRIKKYVKPEIPEEKAFVEYYKDECIRQAYCMPAADVVPKSEVKKHKDEIDRLRYNLKAVIEEIPETKSEVAREIFEEMDGITELFIKGLIGELEMYDQLAELKKKYTGEK